MRGLFPAAAAKAAKDAKDAKDAKEAKLAKVAKPEAPPPPLPLPQRSPLKRSHRISLELDPAQAREAQRALAR